MDSRIQTFVSNMRGLHLGYGKVLSGWQLQGRPTDMLVMGGGHIRPGVLVVMPSPEALVYCRWCTYLTRYRQAVFGQVVSPRFRSVIDDIQVMCQDCANLWLINGAAGEDAMRAAVVRHLCQEKWLLVRGRVSWRLNTHESMQTILADGAHSATEAAALAWRKQTDVLEQVRAAAWPDFEAWQARQRPAARPPVAKPSLPSPEAVLGAINELLGEQ